MQIVDKISQLQHARNFLIDPSNEELLLNWFRNAANANGWFTKDNCQLAIDAIANEYLEENKLREFTSKYNLQQPGIPKKVGLVTAGNIPLVGFHDLLCILLSGHIAHVKLSREDTPLMTSVISILPEELKKQVKIVERLNDVDAFIATGSDNSARYFEYYFKNKPNIIRKNRTSIAVLDGTETNEELRNLGNDIFQYFGLGCRNVSKIFVPKGYIFNKFFENIEYWNTILLHHKYQNNYDYNKSIYLVNRQEHLDNGFLLVKKDEAQVSPLSVLFYEEYENEKELDTLIQNCGSKTQCFVGKRGITYGQAQKPTLSDFADNIDTMQFLTSLN